MMATHKQSLNKKEANVFSVDQNPFKGQVVAVLGDFMLDEFVFGAAERISPEAPVPVVTVKDRQQTLGGAGNVVFNLKSLGVNPLPVGILGMDSAAETVKTMCGQNEISLDSMLYTNRPTTYKMRVVAAGQHVVRVDDEVKEGLSPQERDALKEKLGEIRTQADVIIVSDYGKGVIDQDMLEFVKELWADGHILADPKPRPGISYEGLSLITPNLKESSELTGEKAPETDAEAEVMAGKLLEQCKLPSVLLTRAGDGMTLFDGATVKHLKSFVREVRDVSGAGDTVIATMSAGVAAGLPLAEAAELANAAGGVVVSKIGTAQTTWPEIVEELERSSSL